jgi:hypothetical protein
MRGLKADAREERLKGTAGANEAALIGQIRILDQCLALATEQQSAAERETAVEGNEKCAVRGHPSALKNLEVQVGKVLTANNATSTTLTHLGRPPKQGWIGSYGIGVHPLGLELLSVAYSGFNDLCSGLTTDGVYNHDSVTSFVKARA